MFSNSMNTPQREPADAAVALERVKLECPPTLHLEPRPRLPRDTRSANAALRPPRWQADEATGSIPGARLAVCGSRAAASDVAAGDAECSRMAVYEQGWSRQRGRRCAEARFRFAGARAARGAVAPAAPTGADAPTDGARAGLSDLEREQVCALLHDGETHRARP